MAALDARQPSISITAIFVMAKSPRIMSFLTLAARRKIATMATYMSPIAQARGGAMRRGRRGLRADRARAPPGVRSAANAETLDDAGRSARGFRAPYHHARWCQQGCICRRKRSCRNRDDGDAGH